VNYLGRRVTASSKPKSAPTWKATTLLRFFVPRLHSPRKSFKILFADGLIVPIIKLRRVLGFLVPTAGRQGHSTHFFYFSTSRLLGSEQECDRLGLFRGHDLFRGQGMLRGLRLLA
jgi:hypothetical protein